MSTHTVKGMTLGAGQPKICIPLVASNLASLDEAIGRLKNQPYDLVEFRADLFQQPDCRKILDYLKIVRTQLEHVPLIFTFRRHEEGGALPLSTDAYHHLIHQIAQSGMADIIDIEYFVDGAAALIDTVKQHHATVLLSNHDFHRTPPTEEISTRLISMLQMGADIAKIAVMPQSPVDVLSLMLATRAAADQQLGPVVGISMAQLGKISRIASELSGSAITFGAAGSSSAPGQIDSNDLFNYLQTFSLQEK